MVPSNNQNDESGRSNQNETQHKKQPNSSHISQNSNQSIPTQSPSQSQMFQRNNLNAATTRQLSTPSKSQKKSLPVPAMSPVEAAQRPNNIMVRVNQLEQRLRAFEEQNKKGRQDGYFQTYNQGIC
ncbi:uncharacterized protein [Clytia hemisphaerica]|uniref:uncharacterized protein isoform X2 n=1 Tax=Clytia hemisphaerica TaxID=252671 RepID=UPI0034D4F8A0